MQQPRHQIQMRIFKVLKNNHRFTKNIEQWIIKWQISWRFVHTLHTSIHIPCASFKIFRYPLEKRYSTTLNSTWSNDNWFLKTTWGLRNCLDIISNMSECSSNRLGVRSINVNYQFLNFRKKWHNWYFCGYQFLYVYTSNSFTVSAKRQAICYLMRPCKML